MVDENLLSGMERKKLKRLKDTGNMVHKEYHSLQTQRNKMLRELPRFNKKALDQLKEERDLAKREITIAIRNLKEKRKDINLIFRNKSRWIKDKRKEQIANNPALQENLKESKLKWEEVSKAWADVNEYYRILHQRQSKRQENSNGK